MDLPENLRHTLIHKFKAKAVADKAFNDISTQEISFNIKNSVKASYRIIIPIWY
ncbi:hypothetical protein GCM10009122_45460 [Fulvivirga kasyanovii]